MSDRTTISIQKQSPHTTSSGNTQSNNKKVSDQQRHIYSGKTFIHHLDLTDGDMFANLQKNCNINIVKAIFHPIYHELEIHTIEASDAAKPEILATHSKHYSKICITNHTSGCTGVIQLHSLMYRASSWHVHNMSGSHRLCNPRKQYSTKEQNTSTAIPHNSLKNEPCMGTYRTEIANIYLGYPRETSRAEEPLQGSSRSFLREPWVEIALDAIVLIE